MSYSIEYQLEAIADLKRLTSVIQSRIIKKIEWLGKNFDSITPQSLKGNLVGFYKLRVGDYRVIYGVDVESKVIFIAQIGHRREIYD